MPKDRFFIAPYDKDSGLQNNVRPWLIPDEAFSEMENCYVFRGRVRKRFGSRWIGQTQQSSRLRINLGNTPGPLSLPINSLMAGATSQLQIGQMFSVGGDIFTVNQLGAAVLTLSTNPAASATINSVANPNTVTITGEPAATPVYWFPSLPVMGLLTYEVGPIEDDPTIAFDTEFAYMYNPTLNGFERLANGVSIWQGSDSQFFWATSWTGTNAFQSIFFVTNFDENDPNFMRTWDGTIWAVFNPQISNLVVGPPLVLDIYLDTARILLVFKNRLLALNTWESESSDGVTFTQRNYVNRARYSQVGSPLDTNSWRQDIPGKGNAIDAPTTESIVTAQFIKDRLIVFFEKSTYELVYLGNYAYPFAWQKINTELGAESTFSQVPFDKVVLGIDNIGVHACTGASVDRIDEKIPDEVFTIHNVDQGIFRVYGIRDYKVEMVYWTFPDFSASSDFPYPNRVLVFNYVTGCWSFNDDSITAFGYLYQPTISSVTWDSTIITWNSDQPWNQDNLEVNYREVVAGNQEGFVFVIDSDEPTNAPALQITDIDPSPIQTLTVIDHNLRVDDFIYIQGVTGTSGITAYNNQIYQVEQIIDNNNFTINGPDGIVGLPYTGGGIISRVSVIDLITKEYNFYAKQGSNAYISRVDFMVDTTPIESQCSLTVNYYVSTSQAPILQDSIGNASIIGTGVLETFPYTTFYPLEANSTRIWHPVYFQGDGECIQLELTMDKTQMMTVIPIDNGDGSFSYTGPTFVDFQLGAMCIYAQPTAIRLE